MKRRAATVALAILASVLLAACEGYENYTPNAVELTALAEQYDGADKEAVQGTAVARYLAAEQARIQQEQARAIAELAQATANAAEAEAAHQVTMMTAEAQQTIDARNAQATAQASVATAQAAGTAQALAVRATEQAMSAQVTQVAEAATRTAEARNAQATATERAYHATATQQTYNQQATHTAATATVRVRATTESQQATASVHHATMTRQAEKREAVLGYGRDYGIPLILLVIAAGIGAFAVWGVREIKQRPVICEPSIFGDGQKLRIPDATGKKFTFVDMDLLPGPTLTVTRAGDATAPALRDEAHEERVKAGDQAVDMASRPRLGAGHRARPALPALRPGQSPIRITEPAQVAGWLEDVEGQLLSEVT